MIILFLIYLYKLYFIGKRIFNIGVSTINNPSFLYLFQSYDIHPLSNHLLFFVLQPQKNVRNKSFTNRTRSTGRKTSKIHRWKKRDQNTPFRRLPFQNKIGVYNTISEFEQRIKNGDIRNIVLTESEQVIAK